MSEQSPLRRAAQAVIAVTDGTHDTMTYHDHSKCLPWALAMLRAAIAVKEPVHSTSIDMGPLADAMQEHQDLHAAEGRQTRYHCAGQDCASEIVAALDRRWRSA